MSYIKNQDYNKAVKKINQSIWKTDSQKKREKNLGLTDKLNKRADAQWS